jgi:predicted dehydrogenase
VSPRPVGIGLVGAGWMGSLHSESLRRVPAHFPECAGAARLVAVADESPARAEAAAHAHGYARWSLDWRAVLDDPEVEAVCIAAPNHLHRPVALAAIERHRHVWLEKPAGRSAAETAEIAEAAERAGIVTTVGLNYRHAPVVRHARALIDSGELGRVDGFRVAFLAGYAASPQGALSWRFSRELAGLGVLGDLGSHAVDLVQFLLGPVACATARTSRSSRRAASSARWRTRTGRPRCSS